MSDDAFEGFTKAEVRLIVVMFKHTDATGSVSAISSHYFIRCRDNIDVIELVDDLACLLRVQSIAVGLNSQCVLYFWNAPA